MDGGGAGGSGMGTFLKRWLSKCKSEMEEWVEEKVSKVNWG